MTFTKEQLIAAAHRRIDFANMMLSDNPEPLQERTWSIELALASNALLALRERAEPVAWTDEQELRDVNEHGCGYLFTVNPITPHADPRRVIKLYAELPAPVVPELVPEALRDEIIDLCSGYEIGDVGAQEIWSACRAAMLQTGDISYKLKKEDE